jgi:uncharacterized low-complexity protein
MEIKKKSLLTGSLIAGALFATTSLTATASDLFRFENLGAADVVRANLLPSNANAFANLELKCGEKGKSDSTMSKKGKDGKCGEGKCGEKKKDMKKSGSKKDTSKKS